MWRWKISHRGRLRRGREGGSKTSSSPRGIRSNDCSQDGVAPRPAGSAAARRADGVPGRVWHLDQLFQQAFVLSRAAIRRPRQLCRGARRRGVLALARARVDLLADDDRAAARDRRSGGAAAERSLPRSRPRARGIDLSLRGSHGSGGDRLEMAAEQPVRAGQLSAGCSHQLDGARLDHGVPDHRERLAVLPVRAARRARPAAEHSAGALRGGHGRRRRRLAALRSRHPAAPARRAVRGGAAALDLDVHQVRHALADDPGGRRGNLHPHAADLHLSAHLRLLRGGTRVGDGGDHVSHAGRGRRAVFSFLAARGAAVRRGILFSGVSVLLLFTAFPFAWMIATAFKRSHEIFTTPPTLLPGSLTLENVARLFEQTRFAVYLGNSVLVATCTVLLTLAIATPAAYALTRFRFRGREAISAAVLFTYMFAPIMVIIPFYVLMRTLELTNTRAGLVLAYTAFCLPFALCLLRASSEGTPPDLEQPALVDGASRPRAVLHVVLPLALPGVVATGTFTFILAWNDYIFARVLLAADELKTLPVGIADLYNASVVDWGMIMSAGMLVLLPVLAVFVFIQKYLVAGWGSGGIKG